MKIIKTAGRNVWQDDKRAKVHGSAPGRQLATSQGKLMRLRDRPGRMQGRRP